ncbi:fimbrial protein FimI [Salmonella enterica subsp. enterica]|uniref:Fimbrial protein FimI n=1 Tax=Salmonella enterica I TaxID=59201 RepID=A0A3S5DN60_SALET|nr:fimbrial protein FimI [Salmonella enterica subsp. enterica]
MSALRLPALRLRKIPMFFWPAARVSVMPESAWHYLMTSSGKSYLTRYRFITRPILTSEMTLHFTARYRAISENMTPGRIHSEVWFTLVYP